MIKAHKLQMFGENSSHLGYTYFDQVNYLQIENWEKHMKAKIHNWTDQYKFAVTIGRVFYGVQDFLLNQSAVARANTQAMG